MSTLKVNKIRDTSGSADAITFDPNGGAVLAGVTTVSTVKVGSGVTISSDGDVFTTGITTSSTVIVGSGVTISESGIEASGIGITCANINGGKIGGRRNFFINGAMQVAQRATSSTSGGYVSLDRWYVNLSGGSATFSQETNSNPSETGGIQKYARYNVSTSSDYTHIRQRIEDVTSVPAGTVIISFYAKGTAPSGGLYASTEQSFGSGGSSSVDGTPVLVTSSLTSSWVRYTAQITVGSVDGKTIGAGSYFGVAIGQYSNTGGTAYDLNITGVQLEVGTQATDFEHRSYGEELQLCARYFQQFEGGSNSLFATGFTATNDFYGGGTLPMGKMRAAPTIAVDGTLSHLNYTHVAVARDASSITNQGSGDSSFVLRLQSTSTTTDNAGAYARITNSNTNLTFTAEL
jgi:hypothetical protein